METYTIDGAGVIAQNVLVRSLRDTLDLFRRHQLLHDESDDRFFSVRKIPPPVLNVLDSGTVDPSGCSVPSLGSTPVAPLGIPPGISSERGPGVGRCFSPLVYPEGLE